MGDKCHSVDVKSEVGECHSVDVKSEVTFETSDPLKNHDENSEFVCEICQFSFSTLSILVRHKNTIHSSKNDKLDCEKLKCSKCYYKSKCPLTLKLHYEEKHTIGTDHTKSKVTFESSHYLSNSLQYFEFACEICQLTFSCLNDLEYHRNTIHSSKSDNSTCEKLKCSKCNYKFKYPLTLKLHYEKKHDTDRVKSKVTFESSNRWSLNDNRPSLQNSEFVCEICQLAFSRLSNLKYHKDMIHESSERQKSFKQLKESEVLQVENSSDIVRRFICDKCDRRFLKRCNLNMHKKRCQLLNFCKLCSKMFRSSKQLMIHNVTAHTAEKQFKCEKCLKHFTTYCELKNHNNRMHILKKVHKCSICAQVFKTDKQQKYHIKKYHLRKFQCHICNKLFGIGHALRDHLLVHSEKRTQQCTECMMRFKTKPGLANHKIKHLGIRTHHCFHCNLSFSWKTNLDKHCKTLKHKRRIEEL